VGDEVNFRRFGVFPFIKKLVSEFFLVLKDRQSPLNFRLPDFRLQGEPLLSQNLS